MPKTKFQDFVYTIIMVICMVYTMICYNVAANTGGLTNQVFVAALGELPIMGAIAFILEFFFIGKISQKLALCPIMSFFGSILFCFDGMSNVISRWLQICVLNFPMALCSQLFYIGPFVRFIFNKIFKNKA